MLALIGVGVARAAARPRRGLAAGGLARPPAARGSRAPRVGWPAATSTRARRVEGSSEQREVAAAFNDMTGPSGARAARAARVRGQRVAPAAHAAHRPAAAPRGGRAQDRRPRGRARAGGGRARDGAAGAAADRAAHARARARATRAARRLPLADGSRRRGERWEAPAESGGHAARAPAATARPWSAATEADLAVILDNLVENALNYSPAGHHRRRSSGARRRDGAGWPCSTRGPGIDAGRARARVRALLPRRGEPRRARRAPGSGCRWSRRSRGAGTARCASSRARRAARAPSCGCRCRPRRGPNRLLTRSLTTPYPGGASLEP